MALPSRRELLRVAALEALRQGDLAEIDARLGAALKDEACEPDLVTENPECKTALLRAVERADLARITRYVREFGCAVGFENRNGDTPLSEAFKIGNRGVIKHLLEMGAVLDHVNAMGESALTHTLRCCSYETLPSAVEWLLAQPGAPFPRPVDITEAIILGHHQIIIHLLEYHAEQVEAAHRRAGSIAASVEATAVQRFDGFEEKVKLLPAVEAKENSSGKKDGDVGAKAVETETMPREKKVCAPDLDGSKDTDDASVYDTTERHKTVRVLGERREIQRRSALGGDTQSNCENERGSQRSGVVFKGSIASRGSDSTTSGNIPVHMQKGDGSDQALRAMPKSLLETIDPTYGRTPLMCAASSGAAGTVTLLLERFGADPNAQSPAGHTALTIASFFGYERTVRSLVKGGAEVDLETTMGYTALLQCSLAGHSQIVRVLSEFGADVDRQNKSAETALTTACRAGHAAVAMALLTQGANVNFETRSGRTALHEAMRCNRADVVETLLLDAALNLNRMPSSSANLRSPLMMGVASGSDDALSVLLQKNVVSPSNVDKIGLDLHLETPLGETALTVSIAEGTASSGLLVIKAMIRQVAAENGKSSTQFQAAVLSARMLLSGLKRMLHKAEEKSTSMVAKREAAELCQRAQNVVEAMQEGVQSAKEMLKELAVEHQRLVANSDEGKDGANSAAGLQAAIDAARWTQ